MTLFRPQHNQRIGRTGEQVAASYLQKHGYRIVLRNFKARYGEIDIICEKDGVLIFVEVKTRIGNQFGAPEEAITPRKLREIIQTSQYFALLHSLQSAAQRIDVIAISLTAENNLLSLNHIQSVTS